MTSFHVTELKYRLKQLWLKWARPLAQVFMGLLIAFGTVWFWTLPAGQKLDLWVLQNFFEIRGPVAPPEDVVIVAIDDKSYVELEASTRQPFPRLYVARALENIVKAGPKVIILDAKIPKEQLDPEADQRLEDALRAGPTTIWSGVIPLDQTGLAASEESSSLIMSSEKRFREAAKMELPMLVAQQHGVVSLLALAPKADASLFERAPLSRPLVELANYKVDMPGQLDLINFYGPAGTINRIPLYRLVKDDVAAELSKLKDKIVFLGFQSVGRGRGQVDKEEFNISASSRVMFGVEIHANIVGNLIDGSWIKRFSVVNELSIIYLAALLLAVFGIALTPEKSVPIISALLILALAANYYFFTANLLWVPGAGALVAAGVVTMLGSALYHYVIIKSFKKYIKRTFNFEFERGI